MLVDALVKYELYLMFYRVMCIVDQMTDRLVWLLYWTTDLDWTIDRLIWLLNKTQPWLNVSFKHMCKSFVSLCYIIHIVSSYAKLSGLLLQLIYMSIKSKCNSCLTNADLSNHLKCSKLDAFVMNSSGWGHVKY
jgi:hypothetical protein